MAHQRSTSFDGPHAQSKSANANPMGKSFTGLFQGINPNKPSMPFYSLGIYQSQPTAPGENKANLN